MAPSEFHDGLGEKSVNGVTLRAEPSDVSFAMIPKDASTAGSRITKTRRPSMKGRTPEVHALMYSWIVVGKLR